MSNKYLAVLTQIVRQPRHLVHETDMVTIEVAGKPLADKTSRVPEIIDFSRGGFRLKWDHPLRQGDPITLQFTDHSNGLSLQLPGTIRWVRDANGDCYDAGVQFDNEIDYEQLGELFIAGFLSTDEATIS